MENVLWSRLDSSGQEWACGRIAKCLKRVMIQNYISRQNTIVMGSMALICPEALLGSE